MNTLTYIEEAIHSVSVMCVLFVQHIKGMDSKWLVHMTWKLKKME